MILRYLIRFIFLISNVLSIDNTKLINLAVVACGDRVPETIILLKSAILLTQSRLHFYIFTEPNLKNDFINEFNKWPIKYQEKFEHTISSVQFPEEKSEEWRKLFRLCASQRIFLPDLLKDVDSLLYVDTDVLFLTSLDDIWSFFEKFNSSQLAALTPEHEEEFQGWYNRFARHPYYGKLGLNSGVMLMNLTRMREFKFSDKLKPIYEVYKYNITWGDQCLLNILFHYHPELLYVYDCRWNYRPDHCMYGSNCKTAEKLGATILHGCRRVFQNDKEIAFANVYKAFQKFDWKTKSLKKLFKIVRKSLEAENVTSTYCGKAKDNFLKHLKGAIKQKLQFNDQSNSKDEL